MHKRIRSSQIIGEGVGPGRIRWGKRGGVREESLLNLYYTFTYLLSDVNSWHYTVLDPTNNLVRRRKTKRRRRRGSRSWERVVQDGFKGGGGGQNLPSSIILLILFTLRHSHH